MNRAILAGTVIVGITVMLSISVIGSSITPAFAGIGGPTCNGMAITAGFLGTGVRDFFVGGTGSQVMWGAGGSDKLNGGDDADTICGNNGNDTIVGGDGPDWISPGNGIDNVRSGDGDDTIFLPDDGSVDRINCGDGNDTVMVTNTAALTDTIKSNCENIVNLD